MVMNRHLDIIVNHVIDGTIKDSICRLCSSEKEHLTDAFEICILGRSFVDTIMDITSIRLNISDKLPTKVCTVCVNHVLSIAEFISRSHDAQMILDLATKLVCQKMFNILKDCKDYLCILYLENGTDDSITKKKEERDPLAEIDKTAYIDFYNEEHFLQLCLETQSTSADLLKCVLQNGLDNSEHLQTSNDFENHQTSHTWGKLCSHCGKLFRGIKDLYLHHRSCGGKNNHRRKISNIIRRKTRCKYVCEICGKWYKGQSQLSIHKQTHRNAVCYDCGGNYNIRSIQKHILTHTQRVKRDNTTTYECDDCAISFKTKYNLYIHVRNRHLEIFKFSCSVCSKRFQFASRLKEHLLVHSDEKPFQCDKCDGGYSSVRAFRKHYRNHT